MKYAIGIIMVLGIGYAVSQSGAPARTAQTVSGHGIENSRPFPLAGSYAVSWTATPDTAVGCYHGASLQRADGAAGFEMLANETLAARKTGSTQLYNLASAQWYVKASSGCAWTFTFTPA